MPLHLNVITPERTVMKDQPAELVVVPGQEGELGFEEGHSLLLASLRVGRIRIFPQGMDAGEEVILAIGGGFVEVSPRRVLVLAESAEKPDDIDTERARLALARAEKLLREKPEGLNLTRAQTALARARNRLQVAGQAHSDTA